MTITVYKRLTSCRRATWVQEMDVLGHRLRESMSMRTSLPARQMLMQPQQAISRVWRREIRYRHKEGHSLWIRENVRPIGSGGQLLVVGEDITEIHSLTEKLEYQARYDQLTETLTATISSWSWRKHCGRWKPHANSCHALSGSGSA